MKRVLAILMPILILFTYSTFANESDLIEEEKQSKQYQIIQALEMLPKDQTYEMDDQLTKADFANIILNIIKVSSDETYETQKSIAEINSDKWYYSVIKNALALRIISLDSNGFVNPEEKISYLQAVKMLSVALGYEVRANIKGGYPSGYQYLNNVLKLGRDIDTNATFTFDVAVKLLYNALEIEILRGTSFKDDEINYSSQKDETLLSFYLEKEKIEAIVTANDLTNIAGGTACRQGYTKIGDVEYDNYLLDPSELIGDKVIAYVDSAEKDDRKIYYIESKYGNNLKVYDENILASDSDFSYTNFVYEIGEIRKEVQIKIDAIFIYNSEYIPLPALSIFNIDNGFVELIDNNSDRTIDVVKINSFDDFVVEKIIVADNRIYDKFSRPIPALDNDTKKFDVYLNGKKSSIKNLKEKQVISLTLSDTENIGKIYASTKTVEGVISEFKEEKGVKKVLVSEKWYKVDDFYTKMSEIGFPDTPKIEVGMQGKFYLSVNDIICNVEETNSGEVEKIGYFYDYKIKDDFDSSFEIRVFDGLASKFDTYVILDKTMVNDIVMSKLKVKSILDVLKTTDKKVIAYEASKDKIIKKLYTNSPNGFIEYKGRIEKTDPSPIRWHNSGESFDGLIGASSETVVFIVPNDNEESKFYVSKPLSYFVDNDPYTLEYYNSDLYSKNAKAIVVKSDSGNTPGASIKSSANAFVVDKITKGSENGEEFSYIYGYYNNQEAKLKYSADVFPNEATTVEALGSGDVIQFNESPLGIVDGVKFLFDYSKPGLVALVREPFTELPPGYGENDPSYAYENRSVFAKVIRSNSQYLTITYDNGVTERAHKYQTTTMVTIYNKQTGTLKLGKSSDIAQGDDAYLQLKYNGLTVVNVIKNN